MTKVRHPAACSVLPATEICPCGNSYHRLQHQKYPFTYPHCPECEETPQFYKVRKSIAGHNTEFRFNSKGIKIKTLDDCNRLALEISYDIESGTFSKEKYRKRSRAAAISDTIADFIEEYIFPRQRELAFTHDDKVWMEDWLAPFFADVGVFVVSEMHLRDFIRTFRFKGEDQERAERLFNLVVGEIRI